MRSLKPDASLAGRVARDHSIMGTSCTYARVASYVEHYTSET